MGLEDILREVYACLPESPFSSATSLSASSSDDGGAEDRISTLPDDVLRNAVARLPVKDAARTAVLSPRWRGLWRSAPLILEDRHLLNLLPPGDWKALPAAVSRVLASHPGPFRWVNLSSSFMNNQEEALATWLRLFADKGVETLVLVNRPWPLDVPLPASILRCASLRRLYLGVWLFPDTSSPTVPPRGPDVFPLLQELGICHSLMRERDIEYLLACSPELKTFALILSYGGPSRIPITSNSLCCALFWFTMADELDVVAAPQLQRLIMFYPPTARGRMTTRIKIGHAPKLTVLGYLDTADHVLQIGNTVIKAGVANVTPNVVVPSVKVLALSVDFRVAEEVKTLLSFLRCFPQVETLHVKSQNRSFTDSEDEKEEEEQDYGDTGGELSSTFWQEVGPIECVELQVKNLVLDQFSLGDNELEFLKLCKRRARVMDTVVLGMTPGLSMETVTENMSKLLTLADTKCASENCLFLPLPRPRCSWSYRRASDLSLSDPFPDLRNAAVIERRLTRLLV